MADQKEFLDKDGVKEYTASIKDFLNNNLTYGFTVNINIVEPATALACVSGKWSEISSSVTLKNCSQIICTNGEFTYIEGGHAMNSYFYPTVEAATVTIAFPEE